MNQEQLDKYLDYFKLSWAPTTLKVQTSVLNTLLPVLNGDPEALWTHLTEKDQGSYTIKVTWARVIKLWDFFHPGELNPYKTFLETRRRLFKHAYEKKEVKVTYAEAKRLILEAPHFDDETKNFALTLLSTGMRFSEAFTYNADTKTIIGKGSKPRRVMGQVMGPISYSKSHKTFWAAMKSIGLTPHALRKLAATRAAECGMREADLLKTFGWNSIETAKIYLQPKNNDELENIMDRVYKEAA